MIHVVTVVGARPQFIKASPVTRAFKRCANVRETLVHTGQHYDESMSQIFFDELNIPEPDVNLGIGSGSHGRQTAAMLTAIEELLIRKNPDWVLVYGDTNSTLAAALAAAKLKIRLAHVEAGVRSYNRDMPEEINRVLTDQVSDRLLVPTSTAIANLRREGITDDKIIHVGDVMYDAAIQFAELAKQKSDVLERGALGEGPFILATVHRAENTDSCERLAAIVEGLKRVGQHTKVVLPLHPRTRAALDRWGLGLDPTWIQVMEPVGYLDMTMLEASASLVVTDSGGVQKEAYFHNTPCVTLRDETEWVELLDLGANCLAPPTDGVRIATAIESALRGARTAALSGDPSRPFGDGDAATKVAAALGGIPA